MMLSDEFVASRVYAGDVQRAEYERELLRRLREERAERRAEWAAGHRARRVTAAPEAVPNAVATPVPATPAAEFEPAGEATRNERKELAHAGR